MEKRGIMGTKSRKSRLLRVLTKVTVGAIALAFMRTVPAMAADMDHVIRLNVGAAEVLEGFEEIATQTSVREIMQQEEMAEEDSEVADLKSGLVMADVRTSLNVRAEASEEAEKVGFLYADCGGEILETTEGWTKIKSGNLVGWASNEYLLFGEEAIALAKFINAVLPYGPRAIKESEYSYKLFPPFFIDAFKEAENYEKSKLLVLTLMALFKCDYNCNAACDAF